MNKILAKKPLAENIVLFEVEAPDIARHWKPGQFVMVRPCSDSERIPLTLVDGDPARGIIALVVQAVGKTSTVIVSLEAEDFFADILGPLGRPSKIGWHGLVMCVGGGVGVAELLPVAKSFREAGNYVVAICGARSKNLIILNGELKQAAHEVFWSTDDGSYGFHGNVVALMKSWKEVWDSSSVFGERYGPLALVHVIGPLIMMQFASALTREWGVKTYASINSIMVDGTGMCGGCRVTVDGKVKFACVDGPEFNAHEVDFNELKTRVAAYRKEEKQAFDRHRCKIGLDK